MLLSAASLHKAEWNGPNVASLHQSHGPSVRPHVPPSGQSLAGLGFRAPPQAPLQNWVMPCCHIPVYLSPRDPSFTYISFVYLSPRDPSFTYIYLLYISRRETHLLRKGALALQAKVHSSLLSKSSSQATGPRSSRMPLLARQCRMPPLVKSTATSHAPPCGEV